MKNSIKRVQSQASSSFAERENFRPKVKQLKKTILTLVALLAVTTGAWADGIVCTASDLGKVLCTDGSIYENVSAATTAGKTAAAVIAYVDETNKNSLAIALADEGSMNWSTAMSTCEGKTAIMGAKWCLPSQEQWKQMFSANGGNEGSYTGLNTTITTAGGTTLPEYSTYWSSSESDPDVKAYRVNLYDGNALWSNSNEGSGGQVRACLAITPSAGPEVAWNKAEKTGSFTMPGGNVTLEPEYYPQAELAAAPTAINDVPATTDGAIVNAGTVANIGETETAQGTVMYYVSQTEKTDAALLALAADQWTADVPTAQSFTAAGTAYVYYYVRGNDGDTDETTFSDGDILATNALTVTIAAEPTYAVTFADDLAEPDKWTADPAAGVTKGQTVTVTYTGTKKVIGVKAEKKAAGPLAAAFKDGAKFKVGYQWNGGLTTYLEFTNSGGTYSLTSVSGDNTANGFNSSTLTVKDGNVLALDVVCHPEGEDRMDYFCAQIEFDATSSTYKYSSKGGYFDGIISVSVNDADIISQLTPAN